MESIGLIAGNGRFPFLVAEEIRKKGDRVVAFALKEETDPSLESHVDKLIWLPLGQLQKMIDAFHEEKISIGLMAGQVKHAQLFAGLSLDWRAIKLLGRILNKKTDTILGAVADDLAKEGIALLPSHQYLQHLLPAPGLLCGPKLSKEEKEDIAFGHRLAKQIAGLDIGQSIVVKDRCVVAVESIEGTDECIRRGASLAGEKVIVVKVAKPNQDFRFDIPVVGPRTIQTLTAAKARAIAVDAGATLMIDKDELLETASRSDISIIALERQQ